MMLKQGIGITAFAGAALLASSATNAASVKDVIFADGAANIRAQDGSREDLYTGPGDDGTYGTEDDAVKSGTTIEEGDTIFGVLDIATIQRFPDGTDSGSTQSRLGVDTDNSELTGVFAIQVQSVSDTDDQGNVNTVFGPDPDFSNGDGTVVRFYDDPNHNYSPDNGTRADGVDTASDGDLLLEIGFRGDEEEFFTANGPQDIANLGDTASAQKAANSNLVLNRTTNNGILGNATFVDRGDLGQFDGSTGIFSGGENSPFRIQDEANFSFTVIPTPTAGMAGIAMLGLMGVIRRRRA